MMETLYPIIRRVRRSLLVEGAPPVTVGNVEPVRVEAATPPHPDPLPPGEGTAGEASIIVGEPPVTSGPAGVEREERDANTTSKSGQR